MPHKDKLQRAQRQRERRQRQRGLAPPPGEAPEAPDRRPVPPLPLNSAADCLKLLHEQVSAVRAGGSQTTARTVGYLVAVALRAIEQATIEARLEVVERVLKLRGESK